MFNTEKYKKICEELLPYKANLIAVTKTKPVTDIETAIQNGQMLFGENYVQELVEKASDISKNVQWHFIGNLQRNKVKQIAPFIHTVQTVDSKKLLQELDKHAVLNRRVIKVLLQIHIAKEETKFGLSVPEVKQLVDDGVFQQCNNIRFVGLMGMATNTDDTTQVRSEFKQLFGLYRSLSGAFDKDESPVLSMGMTSDYKIALDEGSNMIRIGSALFGSR
ncbi:MAG: YggS family pyridoxal phosphate-dependent enzyme [Bacteroidia bacterium]|jgi:pyridoxal phosphate enzyme (YggS family)